MLGVNSTGQPTDKSVFTGVAIDRVCECLDQVTLRLLNRLDDAQNIQDIKDCRILCEQISAMLGIIIDQHTDNAKGGKK